MDLCLHRPGDTLLKPLLGLLLSLVCMDTADSSTVMIWSRMDFHSFQARSMRAREVCTHSAIGSIEQEFWDPSVRLLYQAQLLVEDPAQCTNRDIMAKKLGSLSSLSDQPRQWWTPMRSSWHLETPALIGFFSPLTFFKMAQIAVFLKPLSSLLFC
jgi:hypothetical protein